MPYHSTTIIQAYFVWSFKFFFPPPLMPLSEEKKIVVKISQDIYIMTKEICGRSLKSNREAGSQTEICLLVCSKATLFNYICILLGWQTKLFRNIALTLLY